MSVVNEKQNAKRQIAELLTVKHQVMIIFTVSRDQETNNYTFGCYRQNVIINVTFCIVKAATHLKGQYHHFLASL